MNPEVLRASLPTFNSFELPVNAGLSEYLHYYDIDLVASGDAIEQTIGQFECEGFELVGQAFFAAKASGNALVVHGYMDHAGLYGKLIRHLLSQGLNVFIVDLPGHGLSSGAKSSIDSFSHYSNAIVALQKYAQERGSDCPWFLFGQSMGGAVAMSLLQNQQLELKKTILLAPLVQPKSWTVLKFVHTLLKRFIKQVPRRFSTNSHDRVFRQFLKRADSLQHRFIPIAWLNAMRAWRGQFLIQPSCSAKVLVIQGSGDNTVDWRFGIKVIARLFPNNKTLIINEAMHHMANESVPYLQQTLAAIDEFLAASD